MTEQQKASKPGPIRADPAGFKSTERMNARILVNLVKDMEDLVIRGIMRRDPRALANPMQDMASFSLRLVKDVEEAVDRFAADAAAKRVVSNSAEHGVVWATKSIPNAPKEGTKVLYLAPEQKMLEIAQQNTLSEIKGLTNDVSKRLSRTLVEGYSNGETIPQLTKRIRDATSFSKNKAITIARTETLRVGNQAAIERYRSYNIERVEYVAALDDRVCEECESLHGNIYDIGDEPDLPVHPNCRCTYVAVVERD